MRNCLKILCFVFALGCSLPALSKPVLILLPTAERKALPSAELLHELRDDIIAVVDADELAATRASYTLLDANYAAGRYLFVKPGREAEGEILWQDAGRVLVKLPAPRDRRGGEAALESRPHVVRDSRPPAHLDDPNIDPWLELLAARVNADSLMSYVEDLTAFNRYTRWPSNDDAANWVRAKFESFGYDSVYFHEFTARTGSWNRVARNILAVKPGTSGSDSIVVIGGHMDAISEATAQGAPGADDNASGTAGMLEAARLLADYSFRHTLMFIAFNGEEQGLQGSDSLARLMSAQGRRIIGVLNMDMIGYYDPAGADLWLEGFYTGTNSIWLCNLLWDNCEQFTTLTPYLYPQNGFGSDHASFHDWGFPAALSIENEYDEYNCYHRLCDLPNRLTADFVRQIALVNIVSGAELALPLGSGSISGHVTLGGSPNAGGVVVTQLEGLEQDTTDVTGFYRIEHLLPGPQALRFSRTGWETDTLRGIPVVEGQETVNQNITLAASVPGSVAGTITLSGGGGVLSDAIVTIDDAVTRVAANGAYTVEPVFSGQRLVTAVLNGYSLATQVVYMNEGQHRTGINLTLDPLWDLEASNYGLQNHGTNWGWGTDAVAGAHSGTRVWGTVLGGNYANCTDYTLEIPAFNLAHLDSARLEFWQWYDIEPNGPTEAYDGANVSVASERFADWQVIEPVGGYPARAGFDCNPIQNEPAYAGNSGGWVRAVYNLDAFLDRIIRIRFRLGTDAGSTRRGWYLDDIALFGWHSISNQPPQAVENLTMCAAPGGVTLRWSPAPGARRYQIYRGTVYGQPLPQMALLAVQAETVFVDSTAPGTTAFYVVVAEN